MWICILLLVTTNERVSSADVSPCTNYTKGAFGPEDITDEPTCRTACETAEGLNVPDLNSRTEGNMTYYKCTCKSSSTSTSSRLLCQDEAYASGGASMSRMSLLASAIVVGVLSSLFGLWLMTLPKNEYWIQKSTKSVGCTPLRSADCHFFGTLCRAHAAAHKSYIKI